MTDQIDFTEMYVTHDAFRRDLERMEAAALAGKAAGPEVRAGWENFKAQLLTHHRVEDAWLWPRLTERVKDPAGLALLKDMEAEHARLDPLLATYDEALASGAPDLAVRARELGEVLGRHLEHEEEEALPLIQAVMTPRDWRAFGRAMARAQGVRGVSNWIPWIVDGMSRSERKGFLARFPAPLRLVNRLVWAPRYRGRHLWGF
jgi:hypothetical protein